MSSSPDSEITLYHWEPNANSGKPMLTLVEKGVAFKSHYIDLLAFDQRSRNIWRSIPWARSPQ